MKNMSIQNHQSQFVKGGGAAGWREMKSVGETVEGTDFVPCKVPIRGDWTLWHLTNRRPDVKFIIDMAGTEYYSLFEGLQETDCTFCVRDDVSIFYLPLQFHEQGGRKNMYRC